MKRKEFLKYLNTKGCVLVREGGKHSWWINPAQNKRSAVPRHSEIRDNLAKKSAKTWGFQR